MSQASNPFVDALRQRLVPGADPRQPVYDVLERFRAGLEQFYAGSLTCSLVPGFPTNYGQEYKMVIHSKRSGHDHTLFRAYVPLDGKDVRLDTYDYGLAVAADAAALEDRLVLFLKLPQAQNALDAYAK